MISEMKQGALKLNISESLLSSHLHWWIQEITNQTYTERIKTLHNQHDSKLQNYQIKPKTVI